MSKLSNNEIELWINDDVKVKVRHKNKPKVKKMKKQHIEE